MGTKQTPQLSVSQQNHQMVEVCDICGDTGVANIILTCPRCKTSREHAYCRRNFSSNYHDDWSCDDCMGEKRDSYDVNQGIENTVISKFLGSIGRHRVVEKIVTKGKVKCIPMEEVIKMSSGSQKGEGTVRIIKTQVHQKDISSNPSTTSVALPCHKQTSSAIQGQGGRISCVPEDMRTVQAIREELIESIEPVLTTAPAKTKDASFVRETNPQRDAVSSPAPKKLCAGVSSETITVQAIREDIDESIEPVATTAPAKTKEASLVRETSTNREVSSSPAPEKLPAGVNSEKRTVKAVRQKLIESIEPVATTAPAKTKDASLVREMSTQRDALSLPAPNQLYTGVSSVQPAIEARLARKRKEASVLMAASCAPSLKKPSTSGHQVNGELPPQVNNSELMCSEPEAAKLSRVPARDLTWKGQFEILDGTFHDVYFQFEAHPCTRGSRKVLNFSKRMPQLLQFTMIQQEEVWKNLFQNQCPNVDDIGLYFYACEYRSSSGCDLIHSFIESQEFAMRCVLVGVELYVFTSKTLPANYQKLDNEYFLWGVFHKIGKQKDLSELHEELPSAVHEPPNSPQNKERKNDDNDCAVDMEINMIDGQDGVFHEIGKQKGASELYKELPSAVHKPSDSPENKETNNDDNDCAVDVEVNMIDGQDGVAHEVGKQKDASELYKELPSAVHEPSDSPENKETNNDDNDCAVEVEVNMIDGQDGVAHEVGKQKDALELYKELPSAVHEPSDSPENKETNNDDNDCAVDVEVNMIEGQDVVAHEVGKQKDASELYKELPSAVHEPSDSPENKETNNDDNDCAVDVEVNVIDGQDGVAHEVGKQKDAFELYKELPSAVHKPSDSPQNKETKSDEDDRVVDMEIDMIGGEDLEEHVVPIGSSAGATHSIGYDIPSPKKQQFLDCPPGFEEVYRLKMQKKVIFLDILQVAECEMSIETSHMM